MKTKKLIKPKRLLKKSVKKSVIAKPVFDEINFPVEFQRLTTENGKVINKKAVVRTDKNIVLGVVGDKYRLIPHSEVLKQIEETLPIGLNTRKVEITDDGAFMFARYESPKIKSVQPRKGDIVSFGIEIFNSYNGKTGVGMRMIARRLICENGMTVPRSISSVSVRHMSNCNIIKAREEFNKKIELFMKYQKIWGMWTKQKTSERKLESFLKKKKVAKKAIKIILSKFETQKDSTIWGAFNAVTWYGTHVLQTSGLETDSSILSSTKDLGERKLKNKAKLQFAWDRTIVESFYSFAWVN